MKAMILAAGLGTRLQPITNTIPKALVPVSGTPMLEHVIRKLITAGVNTIIINTHHLAEKIEDFLNQHDFGISITTIHEPAILDTAGGIVHARSLLTDPDPIVVHNTDVYSRIDISKLYSSIGTHDAVISVKQRETTRPFLIDDSGKLVGHRNKVKDIETMVGTPTTGAIKERVNCGVYVLSQKFLDYLAAQDTVGVSLTPLFLEAVADGLDIHTYDIQDALWHDIGTVQKIETLEQELHDYGIT